METIAHVMRSAGIDTVDARVLMRLVLNVNEAYLIAHASDVMEPTNAAHFRALAARRAAGEPVAYVVGERAFFDHVFKVTPAVLIPRPETELLVELALERLPRHAPSRVLDLGTGSGCIAISIALACPQAQVIALDRSAAALNVARENATHLNAHNATLRESHWFDAVAKEHFEMIVANPPYVGAGDTHLTQGDLRFEPSSALVADEAGLADIRAIIRSAPAHLAPGGWVLIEHGFDQAQRCRELLTAAGLGAVQSWCDLAGIERVSGASLTPDTR